MYNTAILPLNMNYRGIQPYQPNRVYTHVPQDVFYVNKSYPNAFPGVEDPFLLIDRYQYDRKKLCENKTSFAIPDRNAKIKGHCLIMPKRQVKSLTDLSPQELSDCFKLIKECENKVKNFYRNENLGFKIELYDPPSIPHMHFHLTPLS